MTEAHAPAPAAMVAQAPRRILRLLPVLVRR
jgi:hypothetical protein